MEYKWNRQFWIAECHNEWCETRKFAQFNEKPESQKCPACGWLAKIGSGLRQIAEFYGCCKYLLNMGQISEGEI